VKLATVGQCSIAGNSFDLCSQNSGNCCDTVLSGGGTTESTAGSTARSAAASIVASDTQFTLTLSVPSQTTLHPLTTVRFQSTDRFDTSTPNFPMIGGIVASVVALLVIIALVIFLMLRRRRTRGAADDAPVNPAASEYGVFPPSAQSYSDIDDVRVRQVVHEYDAPDAPLHL
jgi:hypothetical protein